MSTKESLYPDTEFCWFSLTSFGSSLYVHADTKRPLVL